MQKGSQTAQTTAASQNALINTIIWLAALFFSACVLFMFYRTLHNAAAKDNADQAITINAGINVATNVEVAGVSFNAIAK